MPTPPTLLILSQVYVPDPASLGQHMHDAAAEMARRGFRVVVYTSARGYDDSSMKYPKRETLDGVEIRRLPLSSFGKKSIAIRLLGGILFLIQAMLRAVWTRNLACILVSTSPPMCSFAGVTIARIRRVPVKYWAMDLNPDQMIAMGKTKPTDFAARVFDWLNRQILRRAASVVALDRFMAQRLEAKTPVGSRMAVIPPWPHIDQSDEPIAHEVNPFRRDQKLDGKFVIMYSGNISPAHPVTAVLEAAVNLRDDPRLLLLFIGGGLGKREIEEAIAKHKLTNIRLLPYQPLETLHFSLSAGDVHLVTMGDNMVGIVHPCKVYGAMAVGRPVLFLGPSPCHISDILEQSRIGWHIPSGDGAAATATIRRLMDTPPAELADIGRRAQKMTSEQLSKKALCKQFCDVLEAGL